MVIIWFYVVIWLYIVYIVYIWFVYIQLLFTSGNSAR